MPELPDVENYRRYWTRHDLHKRIDRVNVAAARVLEGVSGAELNRGLRGRTLERARRHGKHLLAELDDGRWLALHFGMTASTKVQGRTAYYCQQCQPAVSAAME